MGRLLQRDLGTESILAPRCQVDVKIYAAAQRFCEAGNASVGSARQACTTPGCRGRHTSSHEQDQCRRRLRKASTLRRSARRRSPLQRRVQTGPSGRTCVESGDQDGPRAGTYCRASHPTDDQRADHLPGLGDEHRSRRLGNEPFEVAGTVRRVACTRYAPATKAEAPAETCRIWPAGDGLEPCEAVGRDEREQRRPRPTSA